MTWRQILRKYNGAYLEWLMETNFEHRLFDRIANNLEEFLISQIASETDAREFWDTIPFVREACNNPCTYEMPWAADAYAFSHFLMRYSRTWSILKHLTAEACLPLGSQGVRVLDIGTGPAPVLHAVKDFYNTLDAFAQMSGIQELCIPPPELDSIENSQNMRRFMHHFAEHCGRGGPFGPTIDRFESLDFRAARSTYFEYHRYKGGYNAATGEDEDFDDSYLTALESNSLFRYRLVVFSNFFTLASTVKTYKKELQALFNDLNAGTVVVTSGSRGKAYRKIYKKLGRVAHAAHLRHNEWDTDELGSQIDSETLDRIKRAQNEVFLHLANLANDPPLSQSGNLPDYSNLSTSRKIRRNFAAQIFRQGKWPSQSREQVLTPEKMPSERRPLERG